MRGLEAIKENFEMSGEIFQGTDHNGNQFAEILYVAMTEIGRPDEKGEKEKVASLYFLCFTMSLSLLLSWESMSLSNIYIYI